MNFISQTNDCCPAPAIGHDHRLRKRADKPWLIDFIVAINSDTQPIERPSARPYAELMFNGWIAFRSIRSRLNVWCCVVICCCCPCSVMIVWYRPSGMKLRSTKRDVHKQSKPPTHGAHVQVHCLLWLFEYTSGGGKIWQKASRRTEDCL